MPQDVNNQRCLLTMNTQQLIAGQNFSTPLFPPQEFERTIWSHTIPLGQFGWVDVTATANASASGTFSGGYGPGTLSDICLFRYVPRRGVAGHAHFHIGGRLGATVTLTGSMRLAGEYLSLMEAYGMTPTPTPAP